MGNRPIFIFALIAANFRILTSADTPNSYDNRFKNWNYRWAFPYINTSVALIFEIGSRDLLDANGLATNFDAKVHSFEANPDNWKTCEMNNVDDRVLLVRSAVSTKNGLTDFYPFNVTKYPNPGAGSLYMIDFVTGRNKNDKDYNRTGLQYSTKVNSTRLDSYIKKINKVPELICMDAQESELEVLQSVGKYLSKIHYIVTELSFRPTYTGGNTFSAVDSFLKRHNFALKAWVDPSQRKISFEQPQQVSGACDVLYVREFSSRSDRTQPNQLRTKRNAKSMST